MNNLGAISSYVLAVQNLQVSLIKNTIETQQQALEVLLDQNLTVPSSETLGTNIDINV